jgi:hypothetical protein
VRAGRRGVVLERLVVRDVVVLAAVLAGAATATPKYVALVAVAIAAVGGWWLASRPTGATAGATAGVGHDRAVALARDFFASADAHGAGTTVSNVSVTASDLASDAGGRAVWKINIHGDVTQAGMSAPSWTSHMSLYVDAESGAVTGATRIGRVRSGRDVAFAPDEGDACRHGQARNAVTARMA